MRKNGAPISAESSPAQGVNTVAEESIHGMHAVAAALKIRAGTVRAVGGAPARDARMQALLDAAAGAWCGGSSTPTGRNWIG
jgi:hypothetical protein